MDFRHAVKALITRGEQVLLLREDGGDYASFYTLPGGGVEAGESEPEALRRELKEEISASIDVNAHVTSYRYSHRSRPATSDYQIYSCELHSDRVVSQRDEGILDAEWHNFESLPETLPPELQTIIRKNAVTTTSDSTS